MFLEIAPVLAWEDTFAGESVTSTGDVFALEFPFLDDFAPDAWAPAKMNKKVR
jgi:hypothetical protein